MQAYLTLGSQKHLRAATNGFRMVREQSFVTGGWGPGETFVRPGSDELGRSLFNQPASFETPCGAYGHFKISRYLLRATADPVYGDSMERVLYNTVLGAKPILEDGSSFYYSDFTETGRKGYHRDKWPCCSGTLPQIAADYGISSYLLNTTRENPGLVVNLYLPSRVSRPNTPSLPHPASNSTPNTSAISPSTSASPPGPAPAPASPSMAKPFRAISSPAPSSPSVVPFAITTPSRSALTCPSAPSRSTSTPHIQPA